MNSTDPDDKLAKAKQAALRLLKIRSRSEKEIRERLKLKKFSGEIIEEILEHLKKVQLVDDRQFTKDWINARLTKPFGLRRISFELRKKGIDDELLKEELAFVQVNYPEDDIVIALAKQRAARYKETDKTVLKKRVFNYLAYRGFNIDAIQKAI